MRIFVGGSLRDVPRASDQCLEFVTALGEEIVDQGHILLNGCRSSLDAEIAKAAGAHFEKRGGSSNEQIISYCQRSDEPIHHIGTIRASALTDWRMDHPELRVPEQIELADVTIFVAGSEGTFWAKNWAFYARKPILGVPRFGGAGETIYEQELKRLRSKTQCVADDYETLNQLSADIGRYAKEVVSLAERLIIPRGVFTVMSFEQEFGEVFESFKQVCKEFGFEAERTDHSTSMGRIVPQIESGIRQSAFVIADITSPTPNIFYEVGYARALGKDVILTAQKGTVLPFDVADIPTVFWEVQEELMTGLRRCLERMMARYGR